jgi:hypothetical protein
MFKFIILVILILMIIGSGNVFGFTSVGDVWNISINHQELMNSLVNGFNISYDFFEGLINDLQGNTTEAQPAK